MSNVTLFSQIISKLDSIKFKKLVKGHQTDKHQKGFNSWSHLVSMLFVNLQVPLLKGSVIVADRFYNDFSLLNIWDSKDVYFVVRHKDNIKFTTIKELDLPEDKHQEDLKDEIIELTGNKTKDKYPEKLRRVAIWDDKNQQTIEVITNQRSWTANTISQLYKARWEVEIFFIDIKQQLHIKSFVGTTQNAVMIQIWTALITILILKALKTQAKHVWYLSNLVAFIRLNLFVKVDLYQWPDNPFQKKQPPPNISVQGVLFWKTMKTGDKTSKMANFIVPKIYLGQD